MCIYSSWELVRGLRPARAFWQHTSVPVGVYVVVFERILTRVLRVMISLTRRQRNWSHWVQSTEKKAKTDWEWNGLSWLSNEEFVKTLEDAHSWFTPYIWVSWRLFQIATNQRYYATNLIQLVSTFILNSTILMLLCYNSVSRSERRLSIRTAANHFIEQVRETNCYRWQLPKISCSDHLNNCQT